MKDIFGREISKNDVCITIVGGCLCPCLIVNDTQVQVIDSKAKTNIGSLQLCKLEGDIASQKRLEIIAQIKQKEKEREQRKKSIAKVKQIPGRLYQHVNDVYTYLGTGTVIIQKHNQQQVTKKGHIYVASRYFHGFCDYTYEYSAYGVDIKVTKSPSVMEEYTKNKYTTYSTYSPDNKEFTYTNGSKARYTNDLEYAKFYLD